MWEMFSDTDGGGGIEISVRLFNKVKEGRGFPSDCKIAITCTICIDEGKRKKMVIIGELHFC
jgi:hypothetical protein